MTRWPAEVRDAFGRCWAWTGGRLLLGVCVVLTICLLPLACDGVGGALVVLALGVFAMLVGICTTRRSASRQPLPGKDALAPGEKRWSVAAHRMLVRTDDTKADIVLLTGCGWCVAAALGALVVLAGG